MGSASTSSLPWPYVTSLAKKPNGKITGKTWSSHACVFDIKILDSNPNMKNRYFGARSNFIGLSGSSSGQGRKRSSGGKTNNTITIPTPPPFGIPIMLNDFFGGIIR